jgi:hypothetical protein
MAAKAVVATVVAMVVATAAATAAETEAVAIAAVATRRRQRGDDAASVLIVSLHYL